MKHLTQNKTVIDWIEEKIAVVSPDEVMWIDGSLTLCAPRHARPAR